jgi:lipopolysaccharide transport system ATP-binding protein
MMPQAIIATKLSKRYRIGVAQRTRYSTIREVLAGASPLRSIRAHRGTTSADSAHWALRDVDLEIPRGQTVGIIGRNGAGKSTLLKILSRITEPTSGSATVFGRVGSLLEVGSGFHLELTGRENIYLSGAILGMRKAEIQANFDSIVDFACVQRFVDTPVKHYSTGMYLRLAFAVAAHLQSEILLIDEVLSVGDTAFQQRCIGKMGDVAREGRTVLFVSHNMAAVRSLCSEGVVLDQGGVVFKGDIASCTNAYFRSIGATAEASSEVRQNGIPAHQVFSRVTLRVDKTKRQILQGAPVTVSVDLRPPSGSSGFMLFCILEDMDGRTLFCLRRESSEFLQRVTPNQVYRVEVVLPPLWLSPGLYTIYFKVLFHGAIATASRYLSDKFPFDVAGESSVVNSILHPNCVWSLTSVERGGQAT